MPSFALPSGAPSGVAFDLAHAQGRLAHSIATTLCVIAAARAEREAPPIHAARQHLAAIYGATRLRKRLERETGAGDGGGVSVSHKTSRSLKSP